ncbi:class I SAM-dependent methyltransferase [Vibrio sp. SCSIO 43136]|uniref:class I SAM-dependent methyltransferase n=1 Tax=Vibrio sp. SCSIO 43136 TaxID=2819101 RepID=UPI0020759EFD|nr:class I SAM-dependent methyltransferase [Vibrio sp. SCSIO 43136]USD66886.1 class I SAM-dependent methyltransferase [Vibrio sp. SCSIO 43136]
MKPEEIGRAYNSITHLWESDEFNLSNGIEQHKKALQFTSTKGKALDIGCGCTGRFIQLLLDQGFVPTGLDVSTEMLSIAQGKHPNVEFIYGDICQLELNESYDFITAWDSIWHIPLDMQRPVMTKIVDALAPNGVFIFSFGGVEEAGFHTDDFMGPEVYYSSLGTSGFVQLFIELGCEIKHLEFDQYPQVHTYLIVQKRALSSKD